jgi:exopolysaccharide production protein ExoY
MSSRFHPDEIRKAALSLSDNVAESHRYVPYARPLGGLAKRCIDVVVGAIALVVFLPIFGLVAIAISLLDGRPVLYGHQRVGFGRRPFKCLKFRTMVNHGDEVLDRYLRAHPEAEHEWLATRKLKNDPRTTALGTVLRKLSLDELPQLINVLRGEMSIVGPRPIVVDELKMYGADAHYYFQVRPGLTGEWQVSGRTDSSYDGRVALDRAYVENWSMRKDVHIMLKTVPAVLTTRGSY